MKKIVLGFFLILNLSTLSVHAAVPDANTRIVSLLTTCVPGGVDENTENCFGTSADLVNWIRNVRASGNPLLVNIGPGTFGPIICDYSDVTFRGSGRSNTVISNEFWPFSMVLVAGCDSLNVEDLMISSTGTYAISSPKSSTLHSSWINVEIKATGYGWYDDIGETCSSQGENYFLSSRISVTPKQGVARAFTAACSKNWVFGTEIATRVDSSIVSGTENQNIYTLGAYKNAEIHMFGSNLRTISDSTLSGDALNVVVASDQSILNIQGTGIDVISPNTNSITVLFADTNASIDANSAAYAIQHPGTTTRLSGVGNISAPYLWQPGAPPNIISRTGADIFVDSTLQPPEMFIYSANCNGVGGPWASATTGNCR